MGTSPHVGSGDSPRVVTMNYMIIIFSIGFLIVCGCIADGQENMFKRESSSRWHRDADAFENNTSGFTL